MGLLTLVAVNANELLKIWSRKTRSWPMWTTATPMPRPGPPVQAGGHTQCGLCHLHLKRRGMEDFKAQYPDEELIQDLDPEILEDADLPKDYERLKEAAKTGAFPTLRCARISGIMSRPLPAYAHTV